MLISVHGLKIQGEKTARYGCLKTTLHLFYWTWSKIVLDYQCLIILDHLYTHISGQMQVSLLKYYNSNHTCVCLTCCNHTDNQRKVVKMDNLWKKWNVGLCLMIQKLHVLNHTYHTLTYHSTLHWIYDKQNLLEHNRSHHMWSGWVEQQWANGDAGAA